MTKKNIIKQICHFRRMRDMARKDGENWENKDSLVKGWHRGNATAWNMAAHSLFSSLKIFRSYYLGQGANCDCECGWTGNLDNHKKHREEMNETTSIENLAEMLLRDAFIVCQNCDGEGNIPLPNDEGCVCDDCDGEGQIPVINPENFVQAHDYLINAMTLHSTHGGWLDSLLCIIVDSIQQWHDYYRLEGYDHPNFFMIHNLNHRGLNGTVYEMSAIQPHKTIISVGQWLEFNLDTWNRITEAMRLRVKQRAAEWPDENLSN